MKVVVVTGTTGVNGATSEWLAPGANYDAECYCIDIQLNLAITDVKGPINFICY